MMHFKPTIQSVTSSKYYSPHLSSIFLFSVKAVDVTLDSGINIEKNPWVQHSVVNGKFAETNSSNARVYDTNAPLIRKNGTITFGL